MFIGRNSGVSSSPNLIFLAIFCSPKKTTELTVKFVYFEGMIMEDNKA